MTASSAAYLIDWKLGGIWLGLNATGYSDSDKLMILDDSLDGLNEIIEKGVDDDESVLIAAKTAVQSASLCRLALNSKKDYLKRDLLADASALYKTAKRILNRHTAESSAQ